MYYLLIVAVGLERLVELMVSNRNARWSFAHGATEFGRPHYTTMVAIHTALLVGCVVEPWALHRPFVPWLGWPMLAVVANQRGISRTSDQERVRGCLQRNRRGRFRRQLQQSCRWQEG